MPGAMAPPRYSPASETASKVVAVPKSTTMHGPAVAAVGRDGVDDAVGAQLVRVVDRERDAGAHAGADDERLAVEVLDRQRAVGGRQRRHHRRDDHRVELAEAAAAQPQDLVVVGGELVGRGAALGGDAPLVEQLLAVVDARLGLGVPDVDREQHHRSLGVARLRPRSAPFRISTVTSWVV